MKQTLPHHSPDSRLSESGVFDKAGGGRRNPLPVKSIHSIHGAMGGRPPVEIDLDAVRQLIADGHSIKAAARQLCVGEGTLRRALGLVDLHRGLSGPPTPRQKPKAVAL